MSKRKRRRGKAKAQHAPSKRKKVKRLHAMILRSWTNDEKKMPQPRFGASFRRNFFYKQFDRVQYGPCRTIHKFLTRPKTSNDLPDLWSGGGSTDDTDRRNNLTWQNNATDYVSSSDILDACYSWSIAINNLDLYEHGYDGRSKPFFTFEKATPEMELEQSAYVSEFVEFSSVSLSLCRQCVMI